MKKYNIISIVSVMLAAVCMSSCGAYKRVGYLQDMDTEHTYPVTQYPHQQILRGDRINIEVSSSPSALAAPFNPRFGVADETDGMFRGEVTRIRESDGYLVDTLGYLTFPVLGKIFVEGMSLDGMCSHIENLIKEGGYIKEPVVKAEFTNFKILVMGEFGGGGVISIPSGDMNLLELFARVGDISENANRSKIRIIRTTGDTRKVYTVDPRTKDIYDSPVFYLQQGDFVYAPTIDSRIDQRTMDRWNTITFPLSVLSTLSSFALLFITLF